MLTVKDFTRKLFSCQLKRSPRRRRKFLNTFDCKQQASYGRIPLPSLENLERHNLAEPHMRRSFKIVARGGRLAGSREQRWTAQRPLPTQKLRTGLHGSRQRPPLEPGRVRPPATSILPFAIQRRGFGLLQ